MNAAARLTLLTRIGFATSGLLYIVIALLVLQTGRAEDPAGALRYLGEGGGRVLLGIMAVGLIAYGLWRLSDAAFDIERHGSDGKGAVERAGAGVSGIAHLMLAWQAIGLLRGAVKSGDSMQEGAQTAMTLPGGQLLLGMAALVLIGVGAYQLVKAARGTFLKHLDPLVARQPWARWSGRAGYAARGLVFLITGWFFARAAFAGRPGEAGGTDEALRWLSYPWDIVVAIGLFGFGIFSLIEGRYRQLHDVPVDGLARRVGL